MRVPQFGLTQTLEVVDIPTIIDENSMCYLSEMSDTPISFGDIVISSINYEVTQSTNFTKVSNGYKLSKSSSVLLPNPHSGYNGKFILSFKIISKTINGNSTSLGIGTKSYLTAISDFNVGDVITTEYDYANYTITTSVNDSVVSTVNHISSNDLKIGLSPSGTDEEIVFNYLTLKGVSSSWWNIV